jgi:hypothetical protein
MLLLEYFGVFNPYLRGGLVKVMTTSLMGSVVWMYHTQTVALYIGLVL